MVLLGGVGTQFAPVIGGVLYLALEEVVWRNLLNFYAGWRSSGSSCSCQAV
jgi:branched-chain amino acid transport system permease protein